jgi:putative addiction module antidote
MVKTVTVRQTGTSVSATIPREMAERLHIERGDRMFAVETEDGILLTPFDPTLDKAMEAYRWVAKQYRGALRKLAR